MKMNVMERMTALSLLPVEGNFATLRIVREMAGKIGLSAKEYEDFEITENKERKTITWNEKGSEEVEITLSTKESALLVEALEQLDKDKKLEQRHFSLFSKLIPEHK